MKMSDTGSVDVILDFLRRNRFTKAEEALRSELGSRSDLNGFLQKLNLEEKNDLTEVLQEQNGGKSASENRGSASQSSGEVSKELIVKEIECGAGRNGSESKWRNTASIGERIKSSEVLSTGDKNFTFSKGSEDTVLDLCSWNSYSNNGPSDPNRNASGSSTNNFSEQSRYCLSEVPAGKVSLKTRDLECEEEIIFSGEKRTSWLGSSSAANSESKCEKTQGSEPKVVEQQFKTNSTYSKESFTDNPWSKSQEPTSELWKECSIKNVLPFPKGDVSTSYDIAAVSDKKEGNKNTVTADLRAAIKQQVDDVGRALYFGKSHDNSDQKNMSSLGFPLSSDIPREEFPRLPPVKLKSEDKPLNVNWEEKFERDAKPVSTDNNLLIGSFLDVPIGQDINSSG